jgi:leucyl aminopeptidase (aminopeptidase T)
MSDLSRALSTVIRNCLAIRDGEEVLVVVDPATRPIGEALRDEAAAAGADAVLAVMDERATDRTEPPRSIAAALGACDVHVAPTSRSFSGIVGAVSVPIHLDVVVADASLEVDGRRVLDAGRWVLEPDPKAT